jgi:hypothetical protein
MLEFEDRVVFREGADWTAAGFHTNWIKYIPSDQNYHNFTEEVEILDIPAGPVEGELKRFIERVEDEMLRIMTENIQVEDNNPMLRPKYLLNAKVNRIWQVMREFVDHYEDHVNKFKTAALGDVVYINTFLANRAYQCRHMALLFKIGADVADIDCRLVVGNVFHEGRFQGHAWNVVRLNMYTNQPGIKKTQLHAHQYFVVDPTGGGGLLDPSVEALCIFSFMLTNQTVLINVQQTAGMQLLTLAQ